MKVRFGKDGKVEKKQHHGGPSVSPKQVRGSSHPLIQHVEGSKWFDYQIDELIDVAQANQEEVSEQSRAVEEQAEILLKKDNELYDAWYRTKNRSDANWLDSVSSKGTFADRISVVQLKVQRSPVHALPLLSQLVGLMQRKGLRESTSTLKVLKELFIHDLLPPNRKLIVMRSRPLSKLTEALSSKESNSAEARKCLIMWKFEADLKQCYETFVRALETMAGNPVEGIAYGACSTIAELLCERAEQEQFLLTALVNKLGHPCQKIGSKVSQLMEKLIEQHSNMRPIVVAEVKRLIFRKNISEKAQFYGVHFLRRILLSAGEADLAFSLIQIYLALFRIIIASEQPDHKLVPLLIAGVNKAFPYAKGKTEDLVNEVESLYILVQTSRLPTALNVLKLLFQIHNSSEGLSDRFYASFFRRLLTITSSALDEQFFGLFLKVIQNDGVISRARAFIKRLFQISLSSTAPFAASALVVCGKAVKERPELLKLPQTELIDGDSKAGANILSASGSKFLDEEDSDDNSGEEDGPVNGGWIHRRKRKKSGSLGNGTRASNNSSTSDIKVYDPRARNPLFAYADLAFDVELIILSRHYHPTVSSFAKSLIEGDHIAYDGEPLVDFSAIRFLDRFAFKNPKNKNQLHNGTKKVKADPEESQEGDLDDVDVDANGDGDEQEEENMEIDDDDDNVFEDDDED